jgi:hypothetical protein
LFQLSQCRQKVELNVKTGSMDVKKAFFCDKLFDHLTCFIYTRIYILYSYIYTFLLICTWLNKENLELTFACGCAAIYSTTTSVTALA